MTQWPRPGLEPGSTARSGDERTDHGVTGTSYLRDVFGTEMDRNIKTPSQQAGFAPNKPSLPFIYIYIHTLILEVENFGRFLEFQLEFAKARSAWDYY